MNFILGAYYNREKVFNQTTFEIGKDIDSDGLPGVTDADCAIGLPLGCLFDNSFDQLKKSFAVYSDVKFAVSDSIMLRGGLRYTHDTGDQTNFRSDALGPNHVLVVNLIPNSSLHYKTNNLSGKFGIDYKLDGGNLLYANYSRGYRAKSFNAQAFFDPSELSIAKPESVDAFELGAKTQFADRRVTLNMAVENSGIWEVKRNVSLNGSLTTVAGSEIRFLELREGGDARRQRDHDRGADDGHGIEVRDDRRGEDRRQDQRERDAPHRAEAPRAEDAGGVLHLAGEATWGDDPATVPGALLSGHRAAENVLGRAVPIEELWA